MMVGSSSDNHRREEAGAVAVWVALMLFVFVGAAALAIDLGSAWSTKRDLVIDLDAAALAGARALAEETRENPSVCAPSASDDLVAEVQAAVDMALTSNGDRAEVPALSQTDVDCSRGTVRVSGSQEAIDVFSSVAGGSDLRAGGYSVAKADLRAVGSVMPITFCIDEPEFQDYLEDGQPEGWTKKFQYGTTGVECGEDQPNLGWWPTNSNNDLSDFIEDGVDADVSLGPVPECDVSRVSSKTADKSGWCPAGPGNMSSLLPELNATWGCGTTSDLSACTVLTFLLHQTFDCEKKNPKSACGQDGELQPVAFLDAVVRDQSGNGANSTVTIEFIGIRDDSEETVRRRVPASYLCSMDGAAPGDPNCD